jgi:hypothetical protein
MFLCKPEQVQAARVIALVSCTPEQRCNEASGLQPLQRGKKAAVLLLFESFESNFSPTPLVHPKKRLLFDHSLPPCTQRSRSTSVSQYDPMIQHDMSVGSWQ